MAQSLSEQLKALVSAASKRASYPEVDFDVVVSEHADYAANIAFKLAGPLKQSPRAIAEQLAGALKEIDASNVIERVEVAGAGYMNLYLTDAVLGQRATEAAVTKPSTYEKQKDTNSITRKGSPEPFPFF